MEAPKTDCGACGGCPGRPRAAGFTLIELLVVMAVIAILASLVMPSILTGMKSAMGASCKSRLRQLGQATMMYAKDSGGFLPSAGPHPEFLYWHEKPALGRYIGQEIVHCPQRKDIAVGYGLNHRFYCGPVPATLTSGAPALYYGTLPITESRNPTGTILFCDAGRVANPTGSAERWEESVATQPGTVDFPMVNAPQGSSAFPDWSDPAHARPMPRHDPAKTNCQFFDGHADAIPTLEIVNDNYGDPGCLYDNK